MSSSSPIDPDTAMAAKVFLERITSQFAIDHAILFGSRARHSHRPDSDADIAIIMRNTQGERVKTAIAMA